MTTEEKLAIMRRWCHNFEKWGADTPGQSGYIRMQYSGRMTYWERTGYFDSGDEEEMIDEAYNMVIANLNYTVSMVEDES